MADEAMKATEQDGKDQAAERMLAAELRSHRIGICSSVGCPFWAGRCGAESCAGCFGKWIGKAESVCPEGHW